MLLLKKSKAVHLQLIAAEALEQSSLFMKNLQLFTKKHRIFYRNALLRRIVERLFCKAHTDEEVQLL